MGVANIGATLAGRGCQVCAGSAVGSGAKAPPGGSNGGHHGGEEDSDDLHGFWWVEGDIFEF